MGISNLCFDYEQKISQESNNRINLWKQIRSENRNQKKIVGKPHPFLKWAGGKRQLLQQIDDYIPDNFGKYVEPFVGGGALFFYLLPTEAVLIDNNPVLINAYQIIKDNVDELIELLKNHENNPEYYYEMRKNDRKEEYRNWSNIEKVSRTIYLNRCCFNGLYRVNSLGQFNVPFGKYKNPKFCDEKNLRAVHKVLQDVDVIYGSFEKVLDYATSESFIYLDPPYVPISKTANFTGYTKDSFGIKDQIKLKKIVDKLDEKECKIMLSNSYCDFILDLYKDYTVKTVQAKRAINRDASKRGKIREILILNY